MYISLVAVQLINQSNAALEQTALEELSLLRFWVFRLFVFADYSDQIVEYSVYVDSVLSRGLDVLYVQRLGLLLPLLEGHHSFVLQVGFVPHEDHREGGPLLHAENRLAELGNLIEAVSVYDGVDQ